MLAVQLRTESLVNPRGLDSLVPHFSWQLAADSPSARGLRQAAYRLIVASSLEALRNEQGDTWDSGRLNSNAQIGVACACQPLQSVHMYYWKVMVWDQDGRASGWSADAHWQTGMLASAWKAHWIAAHAAEPAPPPTREGVDLPQAPAQPLPVFRRDFILAKPVATATVAVSGLGQYELHVNGQNVTASVMNPAWTDYRKRVFYNMYDVTALVRQGGNALGVMLGNGMYDVPNVAGRYTKFTGSFGQPKLILQLMIRFTDGSGTEIVTDKSWISAAGPIVFSSIYGGEDYDARREERGWDLPGFAARGWLPAAEVDGPGGALVAQQLPPVVIAHTYDALHVQHFDDGVAVYDLGKNFSGWPDIRVSGAAGAQVKMIAGELLDKSGHVTQASNNAHPGFDNEFNYTLKGGGAESWHPQFSYNGFRYVEVQPAAAAPGGKPPAILALSGSFLHDGVAVTGDFQSSDSLFVQIHELIDQAILSNMVSVLTDCPTREKLGWLEQTHLAATSIMYNYDVLPLYKKMADDMADAQTLSGLVPSIAPEFVAFVNKEGDSTFFRDSPEWGSAVILGPIAAYRFYGDTSILSEHYASMQKYVDYLASKREKGMLAYGLGDWYDIGPAAPGESQLTGKSLTATAIYYQDLESMAEIARILGKPLDAERYAHSAEEVKAAFNASLFHPDTARYDRGSQTANAMPLALGIVPEDRRRDVLNNLVRDIRNHDNHITAGDIGFHYVVRALTDNGRSDVLAEMLLKTDPPSYGYQLKQGATSLTEAWNANPSSSQNHFMLGHAEEWFYRGLAGLDVDLSRDEPQRIRIHPDPIDSVGSASASENTVFGEFRSSWVKSIASIAFDVTIPPGQQATVILPVPADSRVRESGQPLQAGGGILRIEHHGASLEMVVGSGSFHFVSDSRKPGQR